MNSQEHSSHDDNQSASAGSGSSEYHDDIPILTDQIPVVDQQIPVLSDIVENEEDLIPELHALAAPEEAQIPELTTIAESEDSPGDSVQDDELDDVQPVLMHSHVSDHELEQQQWQIEQQAFIQRGDWHALADVESTSTTDVTEPLSEPTEIVLSEEQEAVLEASWERLESLIMDNMPVEIAGSYLSVLEQQLKSSKQAIAKDISLLDEDDLESILDFYQIDRGF